MLEIRERIRTKAEELFMQYGIRAVSMDDIAAQLGMSKKTIYQYFSDKDDLVDAVVDAEIQEMQIDCTALSRDATDAVDEVFLTMEKIDEQYRHINPVVMLDLEKFHPRAFQRFMQHKNKFLMEIVRNNLEWGIKDELYRPDLKIDIISRFRLEVILIPFNITAFPPSKYHLVDVTREILEHYVYGVASPKGYKLIQKYKLERTKKSTSNAKIK